MAKATQTKRQTKSERRRAAAEVRESARRRQARRRTLGYALGGIALVVVVVLGVVAFMGGSGGDDDVQLSQPSEVTTRGEPRSVPIPAGDAVPDFSAPAIGGGRIDWADYEGRPVVLPVWAPWCVHCQAELPVLNSVMQDYPNVEMVTIVTGIGDQPGPDAAEFLADNGITAPTAIDDTTRKLFSAFGLEGYPTVFFIGSDGNVVQQMSGEVPEETLREVIGSLA
jgi:thiol-disulfide isomerase/thioredoxin